MKNTCKYCGVVIENARRGQFGAHLTNCRENPAKKERDKNQIKKKKYNLNCEGCSNFYTIEISDYQFEKGNYKKNCSRACANKRTHSDETKKKIASTLIVTKSRMQKKEKSIRKRRNINSTEYNSKAKIYEKVCPKCSITYQSRRNEQIYCSRRCSSQIKAKIYEKVCPKCSITYQSRRNKQIYCSGRCSSQIKGKIGGLKSVISQNRRSKNEIAFAELCKSKFSDVSFNNPIFNGWDADIVIEDYKVAILWNGKWHYEKITQKHSLSQVQTRDSIKVKEIEKKGYIPYIIKDMGKYSQKKVESEWLIFNEWLSKI